MARSGSSPAEAGPLDAVLRRIFRRLEARPTPDVFRVLLDQLEQPVPARVRGAVAASG
jgi:DNA-binding protein Fis